MVVGVGRVGFGASARREAGIYVRGLNVPIMECAASRMATHTQHTHHAPALHGLLLLDSPQTTSTRPHSTHALTLSARTAARTPNLRRRNTIPHPPRHTPPLHPAPRRSPACPSRAPDNPPRFSRSRARRGRGVLVLRRCPTPGRRCGWGRIDLCRGFIPFHGDT